MEDNVEPKLVPIVLMPGSINRGMAPERLSPSEARILQNCDVLTKPGRLRRGPGYCGTQLTAAATAITSAFVGRRRDGKYVFLDGAIGSGVQGGTVRMTLGDGNAPGENIPNVGPLPNKVGEDNNEDAGVGAVPVGWEWYEQAVVIFESPSVPWDLSYYFAGNIGYTSIPPRMWVLEKLLGDPIPPDPDPATYLVCGRVAQFGLLRLIDPAFVPLSWGSDAGVPFANVGAYGPPEYAGAVLANWYPSTKALHIMGLGIGETFRAVLRHSHLSLEAAGFV